MKYAISEIKAGGGNKQIYGHSDSIEEIWDMIERWDLPCGWFLTVVNNEIEALESLGYDTEEDQELIDYRLVGITYPTRIASGQGNYEVIETIEEIRDFLKEAHWNDNEIMNIIEIEG